MSSDASARSEIVDDADHDLAVMRKGLKTLPYGGDGRGDKRGEVSLEIASSARSRLLAMTRLRFGVD